MKALRILTLKVRQGKSCSRVDLLGGLGRDFCQVFDIDALGELLCGLCLVQWVVLLNVFLLLYELFLPAADHFFDAQLRSEALCFFIKYAVFLLLLELLLGLGDRDGLRSFLFLIGLVLVLRAEDRTLRRDGSTRARPRLIVIIFLSMENVDKVCLVPHKLSLRCL